MGVAVSTGRVGVRSGQGHAILPDTGGQQVTADVEEPLAGLVLRVQHGTHNQQAVPQCSKEGNGRQATAV